jgi:hypothetical protein
LKYYSTIGEICRKLQERDEKEEGFLECGTM